jgi:hypothetical protein
MLVSLPNEIWGMALAHLPLHSLLSASLVSRTWQTFVFPHIYQPVSLAGDHDLEQLAHRVTSDSDPMFSVSAHIRVLCVGDKSDACIHLHDPYADDAIEEEHIEYLRDLGIILSAVVPRLEEFTWHVPCLRNKTQIILLLQKRFPNLCSLNLELMRNDDIYSGETKSGGRYQLVDMAVQAQLPPCVFSLNPWCSDSSLKVNRR